MIINFLILAHKNLHQTLRLIKTLKDNEIQNKIKIYLHLDKKWQLTRSEIQLLEETNCIIIPERISSELDKWSLVEATLALIKQAVIDTDVDERAYYYLLSGQDYPLKPIADLYQFLDKNYPHPYIQCIPWSRQNWLYKKFKDPLHKYVNEIKNPYFRKPLLALWMVLSPLLKPFHLSKAFRKNKIELFGGSAWWCLPDILIKEMLEDLKNNPILTKLFQRIHTPEETVFQILSKRSSFKDNVGEIDKNIGGMFLTYCNFAPPGLPPVNHPYILKESDYHWLKDRKEFFARKFDETIDSKILDIIDSDLSGQSL